MSEALRERHRMMPYLYTMNYKSYMEDRPLVVPMYYEYPEERRAYEVKISISSVRIWWWHLLLLQESKV